MLGMAKLLSGISSPVPFPYCWVQSVGSGLLPTSQPSGGGRRAPKVSESSRQVLGGFVGCSQDFASK